MTSLKDIQEQLLDTQAAIRQTEKAVAELRDIPSVALTLCTLQKRMASLERQFLDAAGRAAIEACSYRMFQVDGNEDPSIAAVTSILGEFQNLFTLVYDAVKHGPKMKGIVPQEVKNATSFGFGYAFSGSTGIVLTIPRNRQLSLFEDDDFLTVEVAILDMLHAPDSKAVRSISQRFGSAVVASVNRLSGHHVRNRVGVEIEWRRGRKITSGCLYQLPDFETLQSAISETSDEFSEEMSVVGVLNAADTLGKTFKITTDDGQTLSGRMSDAIDEQHTAELPRRYHAELTRTTSVVYSTDEHRETYFLNVLRPAK